MPSEAKDWYEYITESMELLREDLRQMSALNMTPSDFGLKVRTHPDNLMITARNKMGSAAQFNLEVDLSEKMLAKAKERNVYNKLIKQDIVAYL